MKAPRDGTPEMNDARTLVADFMFGLEADARFVRPSEWTDKDEELARAIAGFGPLDAIDWALTNYGVGPDEGTLLDRLRTLEQRWRAAVNEAERVREA